MDSTEQRFWFFEHYLAHSNTELKYLKNTQKIESTTFYSAWMNWMKPIQ